MFRGSYSASYSAQSRIENVILETTQVRNQGRVDRNVQGGEGMGCLKFLFFPEGGGLAHVGA